MNAQIFKYGARNHLIMLQFLTRKIPTFIPFQLYESGMCICFRSWNPQLLSSVYTGINTCSRAIGFQTVIN